MLKLKKRELEVLEAMLKVYISLKRSASGLTEEERDKRLNDPAGRKVTRDLIKMSEKSYNNHIMQLKSKKVIDDTYRLQSFLKTLDKDVVDMKFSINYDIKVSVKKDTKI